MPSDTKTQQRDSFVSMSSSRGATAPDSAQSKSPVNKSDNNIDLETATNEMLDQQVRETDALLAEMEKRQALLAAMAGHEEGETINTENNNFGKSTNTNGGFSSCSAEQFIGKEPTAAEKEILANDEMTAAQVMMLSNMGYLPPPSAPSRSGNSNSPKSGSSASHASDNINMKKTKNTPPSPMASPRSRPNSSAAHSADDDDVLVITMGGASTKSVDSAVPESKVSETPSLMEGQDLLAQLMKELETAKEMTPDAALRMREIGVKLLSTGLAAEHVTGKSNNKSNDNRKSVDNASSITVNAAQAIMGLDNQRESATSSQIQNAASNVNSGSLPEMLGTDNTDSVDSLREANMLAMQNEMTGLMSELSMLSGDFNAAGFFDQGPDYDSMCYPVRMMDKKKKKKPRLPCRYCEKHYPGNAWAHTTKMCFHLNKNGKNVDDPEILTQTFPCQFCLRRYPQNAHLHSTEMCFHLNKGGQKNREQIAKALNAAAKAEAAALACLPGDEKPYSPQMVSTMSSSSGSWKGAGSQRQSNYAGSLPNSIIPSSSTSQPHALASGPPSRPAPQPSSSHSSGGMPCRYCMKRNPLEALDHITEMCPHATYKSSATGHSSGSLLSATRYSSHSSGSVGNPASKGSHTSHPVVMASQSHSNRAAYEQHAPPGTHYSAGAAAAAAKKYGAASSFSKPDSMAFASTAYGSSGYQPTSLPASSAESSFSSYHEASLRGTNPRSTSASSSMNAVLEQYYGANGTYEKHYYGSEKHNGGAYEKHYHAPDRTYSNSNAYSYAGKEASKAPATAVSASPEHNSASAAYATAYARAQAENAIERALKEDAENAKSGFKNFGIPSGKPPGFD